MSSKEINDLADLALNYWRLSNWVEKTDSNNKKSAQHSLRQMKTYLDIQGIELIDITGQLYDSGYSADVIGIESEHHIQEDECIVVEMVRPIILRNGSVIQFGKVILGDKVKCANKLQENKEKVQINNLIKEIELYCSSNHNIKSVVRRLSWCKNKLRHQITKRRKHK